MKDTFIMSKKVLHDETWISNSLDSTQPEREVTLKTPMQFFKKLKIIFLLTFQKNSDGNALQISTF